MSEAPIRETFSVQSARYAEKHRRHAGVDLAVYYHPAHAWNVDRMLDALAASLDYYQASFGPYQFDHVRIVEYPGYANYAQAFAGTDPVLGDVRVHRRLPGAGDASTTSRPPPRTSWRTSTGRTR